MGVRVACVAAALNLPYRAYGLYKWFRRVRRPAATQARLGGVCRSKNLDSGMFLRRENLALGGCFRLTVRKFGV